MRLTSYTDYALRVLLYLGARPGETCSIAEMARNYGISQNHLMKVVHHLGKSGHVASFRGRNGGIRLALAPETINVGALIRRSEGHGGPNPGGLLDCGACVIGPACRLTSVIDEALAAFFGVLDHYTLADLLEGRAASLRRLLCIEAATAD